MHLERIREHGGVDGDHSRARRWRRRTTALAGTILLLGIAASLAGGLWWRGSVQADNRNSFQATAADVTATLGTMLRREVDFVSSLRATMTMQPRISPTRFHEWFAELDGRQRQVGSVGTSVITRIPTPELGPFERQRNADPAFREFVRGRPEPIHTGRRSVCLLSAGVSLASELSPMLARELQGDWCDTSSSIGISQASLLHTQTSTGQLLVVPTTTQGFETMFFQLAFYRRDASLANAASRRAALAGWISSSFDIPALIHAAIGGHDGLGVALYHANPHAPAELIGRVGRIADLTAFRRYKSLQIDGQWAVFVSQSTKALGGLSPELQGLLVLLVGTSVSMLLSALMFVLGRSRERALGIVRQKTGELRHQALHDALTGLPNRVLALDRAEQMLARARRAQLPMAALYVDLDGFKHVNDTFGHAVGDELLRVVATRLMKVVRGGDTAARLSGDEFVVLLEGAAMDAGPEVVASRLLELLRQPYEVEGTHGRRLNVSASVGIALAESGTADELLRNADLALYQSKGDGRDRCTLFSESMQTAACDRLTLEMDLAEALAREQLFLDYQPILDLRSERIVGVEALIRWRHPQRGIISPGEFIPLAEESGQIIPIGRWALQEACRQASAWASEGHELGVAVNVSARQLDSDELIDDVYRALVRSGLAPGALTLEITETALMRDAEAAVQRLVRLKQLGIRIAIDDFGTGYSSLAYLRQFPADSLKIDRTFVAGVAKDRESAALIDTLVQLARSLEIQILAEGIEEPEQLHALQDAGCDLGQGFLFSRPLAAEAVAGLLEDYSSVLTGSSAEPAANVETLAAVT
ncbi:MAG TPA: EAL domain-containing protein [Solirubrobacteraceae bacterium]|nr:EAL domain-containing protein [Solirubrobacteraceae bacterium]